MFEWDERKNRANIEKHGIPFNYVPAVFDGPMLVSEDERCDYGEQRRRAIGILDGNIISIGYTGRGGVIRLITARKASRHERKVFRAYLDSLA